MFLVEEDEGMKSYGRGNVLDLTQNIITDQIRNHVHLDERKKTSCINMFFFSDGSVQLKEVNTIYCLEYIPEKMDLILQILQNK